MKNDDSKLKFVENIKVAYLTPLALFMNAIALVMYSMEFFPADLINKVPRYIYIYLAFWVVINIVSVAQEKSKKVRTSKVSVFRYMLVNILCGYSIAIAIASVYVFGATAHGNEVFNYWLMIIGAVFISWLGLHIFLCSEFEIIPAMSNGAFKGLGILIKLISIGILIYLSKTVPYVYDENDYIWMSIIPLLCAELLIGRSYFNLSLYLDSEDNKESE